MLCVAAWVWFCLSLEFGATRLQWECITMNMHRVVICRIVRRCDHDGGGLSHCNIFHFKSFVHESIVLSLPARLHCPHCCNTVARLLGNIRPPLDLPLVCHTPYNISNHNIVYRPTVDPAADTNYVVRCFLSFCKSFIPYNSHHRSCAQGGRTALAPKAPARRQKTRRGVEEEDPAANMCFYIYENRTLHTLDASNGN